MEKKLLKTILVVAIILSFSLLVVGCSEEAADVDDTSSEAATGATTVKYVDNEIINDFITKYNDSSEAKLSDIDNTSRDYKATASCDGYFLTLEDLSSNGEFCVIIDETNETADIGVSGMKNVFLNTSKVLDASLSDDEIISWFDGRDLEHMSEDTLGSLQIQCYPDLELSSGHSRGHITISAPLSED